MSKASTTKLTLIHEYVYLDDSKALQEFLSSATEEERSVLLNYSFRGQRPIHLAIQLNRLNIICILIEDILTKINDWTPLPIAETKEKKHAPFVDLLIKSDLGYFPLQEAASLGNREVIKFMLIARQAQIRKTIASKRSLLCKKINSDVGVDNVYLEMKWDFHSWIPFLSGLCPSDTYKISRSGPNIRVDTTLVGFEKLHWIRGNISFLFKIKDDGIYMYALDHNKKIYQEIDKTPDPTEKELEMDINFKLNTEILNTFLRTHNSSEERVSDSHEIQFSRSKSSWFFGGEEKSEVVSGYNTDVYDVNDLEIVTVIRSEHLDPKLNSGDTNPNNPNGIQEESEQEQDTLSHMSDIIGKSSAAQLEHEQPTDEQLEDLVKKAKSKVYKYRPSLLPPSQCELPSATEYFDGEWLPADTSMRDSYKHLTRYHDKNGYIHVGRKLKLKEKSKTLSSKIFVAPDFPLSFSQLLPLLELLAPSNKHFQKLKDFVELNLPPGFPIKIEIPIFSVLAARITFLHYENNPGPDASNDSTWFDIPSDYVKGAVLKDVFGFERFFWKSSSSIFKTITILRAKRNAVFCIGSFSLFALPASLYLLSDGLYCDKENNNDIQIKIFNSDNSTILKRHCYGWNNLHAAIVAGNVSEVKRILSNSPASAVNSADEYNYREDAETLDEVYDKIRERRAHFVNLPPKLSPSLSKIRKTAWLEGTYKFTPLHYACAMGNIEIIKILLEVGANASITDAYGKKPEFYIADHQVLNAFHGIGHTNTIYFILEFIYEAKNAFKAKEVEYRRKYPMEKRLQEALVGQHGPIHAVSAAVRRRQNGWMDSDKPLVLLFLGQSGVGKTELAKQLAQNLFMKKSDHLDSSGEEKESKKEACLNKRFIRVDMSEYGEKHEAAKFIGAPPGYVGYGEKGSLADKLLEVSSSNESNNDDFSAIVLLDEIEKAHPDALNVLLQLFDEGRLSDGQGRLVDARNTIFVMTSNLGQDLIKSKGGSLKQFFSATNATTVHDFSLKEENSNKTLNYHNPQSPISQFINNEMYPLLKRHFKRDEFLGRIDDFILFSPFEKEEIMEIARRQLQNLAKKAESNTMGQHQLTWTNDVIEKLSEGYNPNYGARSIKHELDRSIVNLIADASENGELCREKGSKLHLEVEGGIIQLVIENKSKNKKRWFLFE